METKNYKPFHEQNPLIAQLFKDIPQAEKQQNLWELFAFAQQIDDIGDENVLDSIADKLHETDIDSFDHANVQRALMCEIGAVLEGFARTQADRYLGNHFATDNEVFVDVGSDLQFCLNFHNDSVYFTDAKTFLNGLSDVINGFLEAQELDIRVKSLENLLDKDLKELPNIPENFNAVYLLTGQEYPKEKIWEIAYHAAENKEWDTSFADYVKGWTDKQTPETEPAKHHNPNPTVPMKP